MLNDAQIAAEVARIAAISDTEELIKELDKHGRIVGVRHQTWLTIQVDDPWSGRQEVEWDVSTPADRYFIHAFTDPADPQGSTVLLLDVDGDATTVDPALISGGNLQLHASSCD